MEEFPNNWSLLNKALAYPYKYFKRVEDYTLPVNNSKKEDFFSTLKNGYLNDEERERIYKLIRTFTIKSGIELTQLYLKSDGILLVGFFERFIKLSIKKFGINTLYCVNLPGCTWNCGLKHTNKRTQTLQDKGMIQLLEKVIRWGISSVMAGRYVKSDEKEQTLYIDSYFLYDCPVSPPLPFDEKKLKKNVNLKDILDTPDDSHMVYFIECNLIYPHIIKEKKTKLFSFAPENMIAPKGKVSDFLNELKPNTYT